MIMGVSFIYTNIKRQDNFTYNKCGYAKGSEKLGYNCHCYSCKNDKVRPTVLKPYFKKLSLVYKK